MVSKPSLHEIAAMPFPQSERALQKYYGVEPWREGGPVKMWSVSVEYSWTEFGEMTVDVEAESEDDAIKIAKQQVKDDEGGVDDFEIDSAEIVARPAS